MFGAPSTITTDRGSQFESSLFNALVNLLGTKRIHTTSYHPIANGLVERFHRQLKGSLKALDDPQLWSDALPLVLLCLRTVVKEDLGLSSAELVFGTTLRLPGQFVTPSSTNADLDPSNYIHRLQRIMQNIRRDTILVSIYAGGDKHEKGVGLLLDGDMAKCMLGYWAVSERVMLVKLQGQPFNISIIVVYAPTADSTDEEIDNFYATLDQAKSQCKSDEINFIMGDLNAKVGHEQDGNTVGEHGMGERNARGDRWVNWCKAKDMTITNTWFKEHPRRIYTRNSPGDVTRNQIDYIAVNSRWKRAVTHAKTYPGADCGSDHIPVVCTLQSKLKKDLDREIKQKCREAKEKWLKTQCEEIESGLENNNHKIYQRLNEFTGRKSGCSNSGCIKAKDGTMLVEKTDILKRWTEYIGELFFDVRQAMPSFPDSEEGPKILKAEVRTAIKRLRKNKAAGPDGVAIEMIEALEEYGVEKLTEVINKIYEDGSFPEDLSKSIFIALPKKPGAVECEKHRTISLMSHVTKIILRILLMRARSRLKPEIGSEQYGFVKDSGTRNAIFVIRMITERAVEMQRKMYTCVS
ncbi:uncharacterized protein [Antedon mediterranea]|uniref:uncharacterized protein n=1 Tax=Antedon mediterranea TaxID=105859 RepID=UPI003AF81BB2